MDTKAGEIQPENALTIKTFAPASAPLSLQEKTVSKNTNTEARRDDDGDRSTESYELFIL